MLIFNFCTVSVNLNIVLSLILLINYFLTVIYLFSLFFCPVICKIVFKLALVAAVWVLLYRRRNTSFYREQHYVNFHSYQPQYRYLYKISKLHIYKTFPDTSELPSLTEHGS